MLFQFFSLETGVTYVIPVHTLRYTDPTGHMQVEDGPQSNGCSNPKYCNNGNPKSAEELAKMRNKKKSKGGGSLMPAVPPGLCSGPACPIAETVVSPYPDTLTYHPLDSNIVYDLPIYDYSYYPPKLIGHQTLYYTHDDVHFSLRDYLVPSGPIGWTSAAKSAGDILLKAGSKNLGDLSKLIIGPICPECTVALSVASGIDSVNSAITFEGHLERHIYYYTYQSPFGTPFDPKKIR